MIVVVFRSRLAEGIGEDYTRRAGQMYALGSAMPGFVSGKDFVAEDGERLSLIEFESEAQLAAWREHPEHRAAQAEGRARFYDTYRLQVCEQVRVSAWRREA